MIRRKYFVQPSRDAYTAIDVDEYAPGFKTYAEYNYLRAGVASSIKRRHFEAALELTKDYFQRSNVIDFGCADGVFLPSLSRHFDRVLAIDRNPVFIKTAAKLVEALRLDNVEVRSSETIHAREPNERGTEQRYHIMYLLEIIEHIGSREALYQSKIDFLKNVSSLIENDGLLVISVPKMIGIPFLLQRLGLAVFGLQREEISFRNLLRAGLFRNTDDLEKNWQGVNAHLGFNHKKLERYIARNFTIVKKKHLLFQMIYVVRKKTHA
jgi:2-polyprenyl-3-methyl-5-hydroxy-6-metoxy-1,4-benzoquinol methylase